MTAKKGNRTYQIGGIAVVWTNVKVKASSLAEAFELSKSLTCDDFLKSKALYDSQFKIVDIYDLDFNLDL